MGEHAEADIEPRCSFRREALPWIESVGRFARSLSRSAADADDLVQETYLRAYLSWHTFEIGTDCRRWLFTICRNVHRRQKRDARDMVSLRALAIAGERYSTSEASPLESIDTTTDYDDLVTRLDVASALDSALPLVPEPYRSTLIVVLVHDQTYEAAAEQLHVPIGTVRSRLSRGRRLVQNFLISVARDAGVLGAASDGPARRRVGAHVDEQCAGQRDEESGPRPRQEHCVHAEMFKG